MENSGAKYDDGKLRFDLIPAYPLSRLAEVYTLGAKKYADRNWEKGIAFARIFAAMMRHAWKWWNGESYDPDGQHHLASVAWAAFALMEYENTHPEMDDRPSQAAMLGTERYESRTPEANTTPQVEYHPKTLPDATGYSGTYTWATGSPYYPDDGSTKGYTRYILCQSSNTTTSEDLK